MKTLSTGSRLSELSSLPPRLLQLLSALRRVSSSIADLAIVDEDPLPPPSADVSSFEDLLSVPETSAGESKGKGRELAEDVNEEAEGYMSYPLRLAQQVLAEEKGEELLRLKGLELCRPDIVSPLLLLS